MTEKIVSVLGVYHACASTSTAIPFREIVLEHGTTISLFPKEEEKVHQCAYCRQKYKGLNCPYCGGPQEE